MKSYQKILAVFVLSSLCVATAMASEGEVSAKKSKKHHAEVEVKAPCEACEAIKRLEEKVASQQAEIDQLKGVKPAEAGTTDAAAEAAAAAAKQAADAAAAAAAEANAKAAAAQADVNSLKPEVASANAAAADAEKKVGQLEEPAYVHYKGVHITPGGYGQFAGIYRVHNENADTASSYGAFPLEGSPNSHVNEFRESGRASRLSLKVEGEAKDMKFLGYFETDFLGSSPNASESQTSSYAPRLRLAFASVKKGSWRITGGQNWSLLQTTKEGISPLTEWLPMVIDNSYTPGFTYARQGSIRVTKSFGNKVWFAVAAENPETVANANCVTVGTTTLATCTLTTPQGLQNGTLTGTPIGSSFVAVTSAPSNDIAPDLIAKIAVEPGWGHYEVKMMGRFFRDRVYSATAVSSATLAGHNDVAFGEAVGASAIFPVIAKKFDVEIQALAGKGIGRYGTAGAPDATFRPDNSLEPVKGLQLVVGLEGHPTPKLDIYAYGGDEYYGRTTYSIPVTGGTDVIGYGSPAFIDSGCNSDVNGLAETCQSQTRNLWAVQPGFWYRMYKGKAGTVQFGASYAYIYRRTWDGASSSSLSSAGEARPLAIENQVMTAFRYYIP